MRRNVEPTHFSRITKLRFFHYSSVSLSPFSLSLYKEKRGTQRGRERESARSMEKFLSPLSFFSSRAKGEDGGERRGFCLLRGQNRTLVFSSLVVEKITIAREGAPPLLSPLDVPWEKLTGGNNI